MPPGIYATPFMSGLTSPEDKDQVIPVLIELRDHSIRELFPALSPVRASPVVFHRQNAIEQKHALPRPGLQAAMSYRSHAQIAFKFLVDIDQGGRHRDTRLHRETQAMRLPGTVVRVLAKNNNLYRLKGCQIHGQKVLASFGVNDFSRLLFLAQELTQALHAVCCKGRSKTALPAGFEFDIRHSFFLMTQ